MHFGELSGYGNESIGMACNCEVVECAGNAMWSFVENDCAHFTGDIGEAFCAVAA
jgi:hypothetical protein